MFQHCSDPVHTAHAAWARTWRSSIRNATKRSIATQSTQRDIARSIAAQHDLASQRDPLQPINPECDPAGSRNPTQPSATHQKSKCLLGWRVYRMEDSVQPDIND